MQEPVNPMRILSFLLISTLALAAEIPTENLWIRLRAKREALSSAHQELEVTQTTTFASSSNPRRFERLLVLDLALRNWREKSVSGSGARVRIFDGKDLLFFEEGGEEFVRVKRGPSGGDPVANAYHLEHPDWPRARELERRPCNFPGIEHQCVIIEIPIMPAVGATGQDVRVLGGVTRVDLDLETGLLVSSRVLENVQNRSARYQTEVRYTLKKMIYGGPADAALFRLPSPNMAEVRELSKWNAAKIRKRFAGQPAPELTVTDIDGKPITLATMRGKTVLLDFWTTWCGPCRIDAPALDRLYKKYGGKRLVIVGISVSEDRAVVGKFLAANPHSYPIVLTTENDMPQAYQIGIFPTYIVIDPDGTLTSVLEGDQGFAELRKVLKRAGLESE
jgi:thiol-disulfide isomerase/thioredoxin